MKNGFSLLTLCMVLASAQLGCQGETWTAGEGRPGGDANQQQINNYEIRPDEQLLITIESDVKPGKVYKLLFRMIQGTQTATKLIFVAPDEVYEYDLAKLKDGIVMLEEGDHKVVKLNSRDFDPKGGGPLTLDYLYSGISGARRTFDVETDLNAGKWETYANLPSGRVKFTSMFLWANKFLGKIVGISKVTVK